MGVGTYSRTAYRSSVKSFTSEGKEAADRGKQTVKKTGKLDPLVDPAEFGVVRESRIRLTEQENGGWVVSVGAPGTLEYRLDTTGSMGDNVDKALKALPQICELVAEVMPGRDPFYCASIFGDVVDQFVLCRGQFEVLADRMVNQLTLMHPEGNGGDSDEDPHYGIFGAAYLTNAYLHRIGLKSMDFTITDAGMHERLSARELERIFGKDVFEKAKENGHDITAKDLPSNSELVKDMLKRAHGFALMVAHGETHTVSGWQKLYGKERVIVLPRIEHVPHIMAAVTGLTEGTLDLNSAKHFLEGANLSKSDAERAIESIAHIPLNAQCDLPNYGKLPKKGDYFAQKTDLYPVDPDKVPEGAIDLVEEAETADASSDDGGWL